MGSNPTLARLRRLFGVPEATNNEHPRNPPRERARPLGEGRTFWSRSRRSHCRFASGSKTQFRRRYAQCGGTKSQDPSTVHGGSGSEAEDGSEAIVNVVDQDLGQAAGLIAEQRPVDQLEPERNSDRVLR